MRAQVKQGSDTPHGFDLLRILAAAIVIIGHARFLLGRPGEVSIPVGADRVQPATIGVFIFFAISGYLIAGSWLAQPTLGPFALKRALRLLPGMAVMVVLTAGVLGPLLSNADSYWTNPATWRYALGNLSLVAYAETLPGVFTELPVQMVAGTVWTLGVELACYVMVALLGRFALLNRPRLALVAAGAATIFGTQASAFGVPYGITIRVLLVAFFLMGLAIRVGSRPPVWVGLACLALLAIPSPLVGVAIVPGIASLVVWLGTRPAQWAAPIVGWGDPSYGMYLSGFTVQQLLVASSLVTALVPFMMVSLALSAALGYLSWHLVERPVSRWGRARWLRPQRLS